MERIDVAFVIIGVIIAILLIGSSFETAQYCSAPPIKYSRYFLILILLGVGLAIKTAPEKKEEI